MNTPWMARAMRTFAIFVLIALTIPTRAQAAGTNLSWNDCGSAGAVDQTFACNTNSGSAVLVGSFVAPSGIDTLVAVTATLDLWSSPDSVGTPISDWWQLGEGGCRVGSIGANADFTSGPYTCTDLWSAQAMAGLYYAGGVPSANHATLRVGVGVPRFVLIAPTADVEYYAFKIVINFKKTVGSGSCGGCASPMSIALSSIALSQPAPVQDVILTQAVSSTVVTWQGGVGLSPGRRSSRAVTYGQVRSLYR